MRRVLIIVCAFAFALPAFAQFTVKTVNCAGADRTRFFGMNDNGAVVGAMKLPSVPAQAMVYQRGQCTSLEPYFPVRNTYSTAQSINNHGDIVGLYSDGDATHGYLLRNGVLTTLDYPGVFDTEPWAIGESGTIVGFYLLPDDPSGYLHGFIYQDGTFAPLTLRDAWGAVDVLPAGINARGDIVGDWDTDNTTIGHAFVIPKNGQPTAFDAPGAPANGTFGSAINDRGDIAGYFGEMGSPVTAFAVIHGNFITVPAPDGTALVPYGLNNRRQIVGNINYTTGQRYGFIATPTKGGD